MGVEVHLVKIISIKLVHCNDKCNIYINYKKLNSRICSVYAGLCWFMIVGIS